MGLLNTRVRAGSAMPVKLGRKSEVFPATRPFRARIQRVSKLPAARQLVIQQTDGQHSYNQCAKSVLF
jgi:hypothetical protein